MKPYLREKLDRPCEELFTKAACHIFADELFYRLTEQGYRFKRVSLKKPILIKEALHVYVAKGDVMIDVIGQRSEQKYLDSTKAEWTKPGDPADVEVFECDRDQLFTPVPQDDDTEKGCRNKWNLHVDQEFIAACRERATRVIDQKRQTYGLE